MLRFVVWILVALGLTAGLVYGTYALAPAVGPVDRRDLAFSVTEATGGAVPFTWIDRCRPRSGELRCYVEDTAHSGRGAYYALKRRGERCWSARKRTRERAGKRLPERERGCVSLREQLR